MKKSNLLKKIENPCCDIKEKNFNISQNEFAYFSSSNILKTDDKIKNIIFNDIPILTDIFDYNDNYIKVKKSGWFYIQYIINIPINKKISTILSINIDEYEIEGSIININTKNKTTLNNTKSYSTQTVLKIKENSNIFLKSSNNINIKAYKEFINTSSIFILKIL